MHILLFVCLLFCLFGLFFVLTKNDIDRILSMARAIGDKDVIRKLTPRKDLRSLKRDLISSIRHNQVEPELWQNYVEAMSQQQPTTMPVI